MSVNLSTSTLIGAVYAGSTVVVGQICATLAKVNHLAFFKKSLPVAILGSIPVMLIARHVDFEKTAATEIVAKSVAGLAFVLFGTFALRRSCSIPTFSLLHTAMMTLTGLFSGIGVFVGGMVVSSATNELSAKKQGLNTQMQNRFSK